MRERDGRKKGKARRTSEQELTFSGRINESGLIRSHSLPSSPDPHFNGEKRGVTAEKRDVSNTLLSALQVLLTRKTFAEQVQGGEVENQSDRGSYRVKVFVLLFPRGKAEMSLSSRKTSVTAQPVASNKNGFECI